MQTGLSTISQQTVVSVRVKSIAWPGQARPNQTRQCRAGPLLLATATEMDGQNDTDTHTRTIGWPSTR